MRILCNSLGRAIDTLGVRGYVTPEIFRIQSFLAVSHVDIAIYPLKGIIPGHGKTEIEITFKPETKTTAFAEVSLKIS